MRFCMRETCCSNLRQGSLFQLSLSGSSTGLILGAFVCAILVTPLHSRSPCLRQHIQQLSCWLWLLRQSRSQAHAGGSLLVASICNESGLESYPVPMLRFALL